MTIEEILDDLKVPFLRSGNQHCRPGWVQLDCPFCGPSSQKYHLGFNLASKYFNCWKCGGLYFPKVLEELGVPRQKAHEYFRSIDTARQIKRERTRISTVVPAGIGPLLPAHRDYLSGRGFDPDYLVRTWGLGGIGISARLGWRIYIPIFFKGKQVSWTTRAIGDRVAQRYISASAEQEEVNHKSIVYGHDMVHHSVVIVEGPADAWAIGPGAGALFGTAFSAAQVGRLVEVPHRFVCFDSSPDAQARARELAGQLAAFPGETENIQLDAKDPGEASEKELNLLRKIAGL